MQNYKYKATIIVPVYNVEKYIARCLESLIIQTIDHSLIEVLLIDDGSTDGSSDICKKYAKLFPYFRYYYKDNEGLSATRNYGIKRANGKYLFFLDSDDTFTAETIKEVTDFFDTIYDEVDLVAFRDQAYKNGKKLSIHFRYNYLTESGIYDLNEFPYICQTRVSVCAKNLGNNNILFDTTPEFRHEDQKYNNEVLERTGKIGYCAKGEYCYIRNDSSIMALNMYPLYIFNTTMNYYEDLFSKYEIVPPYIQAMFVHDLNWKLSENLLYPYDRYYDARNRIQSLIDRIDDQIILEFPKMDSFRKHYFLQLKSDFYENVVISDENEIKVVKRNQLIYKTSKFEIILNKISIKNGNYKMLAFLKSSLFVYAQKPVIEAVITYTNGSEKVVELDSFTSAFSWYFTKEKTDNFYAFYLEFNLNTEPINNYYIRINIDGFTYPTYYWFMPSAPFSNKIKNYTSLIENYEVSYKDNSFYISEINKDLLYNKKNILTEKYTNNFDVYMLRKAADDISNKRIWLYYDCRGIEKDNGYYQFIHDFNKKDDVARFYINANSELDISPIFTTEQLNHVIDFGSMLHKILFISAEKIITAYIEDHNVDPFQPSERAFFANIINHETIYLQHGILHAHIPWKYSPGRINCDKIVISSYFEIDNFKNTYHFRDKDLIKAGMPRYDFFEKGVKTKNRILFAPSWRNYLIGSLDGNKWNLTEDKFLRSNYFKNINNMLSSDTLNEILRQNNITLDFKIHPIFQPYLYLFDIHDNPQSNISVYSGDYKDEEYDMFITDFSSYVFDFVYLQKTILYFVPDEEEFLSGMNQYRELDLPFERAFGEQVNNFKDAIQEIEKSIKRDFRPLKKYHDRMKTFFLQSNNDNAEKIYNYLYNE